MPKLPVLSGQDLLKALERLGFEQVRQRGSHVVMRRGSAGCVVPMHKEVKTGTLAGILRQAGVTQDELMGAVK
jgi:predicted RNA binding protein YcfA (HicA-like mRNA interferase family)